jgi:uncharacterized protein involved in exopolysaccharide biosynthesis
MSIAQYLRIIWARKWLVLALLLLTTLAGTLITLFVLSKQYQADASLVVEVRNDPVLGALAPGLASPAYLATQVEILKSDRVAGRVVKMLGVERSPAAVQQWRESTDAKVPLDRYFAALLQARPSVEPSRGSNVINITFVNPDAAFAAAAATASPRRTWTCRSTACRAARQSATCWTTRRSKLRTTLETAQAKLSKFQQDKGIVVTDERMRPGDRAPERCWSPARDRRRPSRSRRRSASATAAASCRPTCCTAPSVQALKAQLAVAETKLTSSAAVSARTTRSARRSRRRSAS